MRGNSPLDTFPCFINKYLTGGNMNTPSITIGSALGNGRPVKEYKMAGATIGSALGSGKPIVSPARRATGATIGSALGEGKPITPVRRVIGSVAYANHGRPIVH